MAQTKPAVKTTTATNDTQTTTETVKTPDVKPEPTSEKLQQLQTAYRAKWNESKEIDPFSTEGQTAQTDLQKLFNDIKAEKAAIVKAENDAKLAEQRNARKALLDDVLALQTENVKANAPDSTLTIEQKNEVNDRFKKAYDIVANELMARYATSSPAKTSTPSANGTGTKGATSQAIRERYIALRAEGKNDTEARRILVKDEGFNDGTMAAAVLAYQIEIGEKQPKA